MLQRVLVRICSCGVLNRMPEFSLRHDFLDASKHGLREIPKIPIRSRLFHQPPSAG